MLIVLALVLFAQLVMECDSSNHIKTNLVGEPDNIHTIYKSLFHMDMGMNKKKEDKVVGEKENHIEIVNRISIPESEGIRLLISVIGMLWDTAWKVGVLYSGTLVYMGFGILVYTCVVIGERKQYLKLCLRGSSMASYPRSSECGER